MARLARMVRLRLRPPSIYELGIASVFVHVFANSFYHTVMPEVLLGVVGTTDALARLNGSLALATSVTSLLARISSTRFRTS